MSNNFGFSSKQLAVLSWWYPPSPKSSKDAIICDGAIRSGKSYAMFMSYIFWSFSMFKNETFAICGKTITSLSRNLINPMIKHLEKIGFECDYKVSKNKLTIKHNGRTNIYYIFGGKDEGSASLIQGITLAGILFDEVVLMPKSFVEQALARCSVEGSKYWFNCNPDHPHHWFYRDWICKTKEKNVYYVHFKIEDNPSISAQIKRRYEKIYTGSFYKRFIEGKWCAKDGLIYNMFDKKKHVVDDLPGSFEKYYISCDYGTVNPMSMGLWGKSENKWYRIRETYYSSKRSGRLKTDEEYYKDLLSLAGDLEIEAVIIDPSAKSFSQCIVSHETYRVISAKNDVVQGIAKVSEVLVKERIYIHNSCKDTLREFSLYQWSSNDSPKKENDHAMDDIRYFVNTVLCKEEEEKKNSCIGFFTAKRRGII